MPDLRSLLTAKARARDLAVWLVTASGLAALPWLLSGPVHRRTYSIYRLMWLNLTGHAYRMPIDTPQPLLVLRAGLTDQTWFFLTATAALAALPIILGRLGDRLYGRYSVGLGAFVLVLLGNQYMLPGPFLSGYWPVVYFTLVAGALWLFAERRYGWGFGLLGISGLLRPESWGLIIGFWTLLFVLDRDRWRARHGLALAAAPAWVGFDWLLSGDPLYSYHTLQRYREYVPVDPTDWRSYWPDVVTDVSADVALPLLAVGLLGLGVALWTARSPAERRGHWGALLVTALPPLGYWGVSIVTEVIVQVRFLTMSMVMLLFYAAALPVSVARLIPPSRDPPPRTARAVLFAAWIGLLLLVGAAGRTWRETRETAREMARKREVRDETIRHLEKHWAGGGRSLLAGRSIEVFELALGETPSGRMHQYRVVEVEVDDLARLGRGTAVYLYDDVAGFGVYYDFLRSGVAYQYGDLRFTPLRPLEGPGGRTRGFLYRYTPESAPPEPEGPRFGAALRVPGAKHGPFGR